MIRNMKKKPMIIGIISTLSAIGIVLLLLLPKKAPDPYSLLAKAQGRIAQNLCRLAILEENPEDEGIRRELLISYQQYAEPLTLYSAQQEAEKLLEHAITLPEGVESDPQVSAAVGTEASVAQGGFNLKDVYRADGMVSDGTIIYFTTDQGIYANYKGLEIKLTHLSANRMIPAKEGLYFLSTLENTVKYLAGDGSYITTLSYRKAKDFTFIDDTLYILDTEGRIYAGETRLETPIFNELCTVGGTLYACGESGLYTVGTETKQITASSLSRLTAGEDGALYYLNEEGYPCRLKDGEAVILKEKTATAIGQTKNDVYILNKKGKIRKI